MSMLFVPLPGNAVMAKHLAGLADGTVGTLETRRFPDGERYLRFPNDLRDRRVALVCTLDRPDQKIPTLLFAARTARELGARQVGLVAPYLCYMRQDTRFHPGEAVTARCFAELISADFDWLVTLDPHLHRFTSLSQLYSVPARAAHAGPAIAKWIKDNVEWPFLIGPDEESLQWIRPVAKACGTSAACTVTGVAPSSSAMREMMGDWARKRTPRRSSTKVHSSTSTRLASSEGEVSSTRASVSVA